MTINRTTLLDLPLPVTGTESGTWGDITNNGLAQYVDIAVAGMNSLTSSDFTAGALTISNTQGDSGGTNIAAGSAQYATIKVSSLAQNSTITAPASNRSYRIVNADSTYSLTIKASGQTGVTFLPGQTGVVAFTGTDYEVVGVVNAASSTDNAVPKFDGTTGQIIQNTGVTIDDSNNVSGVAQLNATTVDATNIEVTNIKAKDGTSAGSIADSTGVVTFASTVLTTTDINGGSIDGVTLGTNSAVTEAQIDNININGNSIISTNSNGNIALTPDGTGEVDISKVDIAGGEIDAVTLGTNSAVTEAQIDNINIDGNTISTTDTDGNLILSPDGDGVTQEEVGGTNYALASQYDVGTNPNQIPLNQYLGALAYEDTESPALDIGTGITTGTGTICVANGGLSGGVYKVTIVVDLTGLNSGGTAGDIIGVNGTALPCYIARLPAMTVLGGRMTCLELPAGGDTDIDLYSANEGTGTEDSAITGLTETQIINAGTQALGTLTYFSAYPTTNQYLYLVGQSTSNATYTAGRFLIEIFGVK